MSAEPAMPSFSRMCMDFAIAYCLAIVGIVVLIYALEAFLGYDAGAGMSLVPVLVAALYAGQKYGGRARSRPGSGLAWKASLLMTLTALCISVVAGAAIMVILGADIAQEFSVMFAELSAQILALIIFITCVIQLLVIRFFFGMGAKQVVKAQEKETVDKF